MVQRPSGSGPRMELPYLDPTSAMGPFSDKAAGRLASHGNNSIQVLRKGRSFMQHTMSRRAFAGCAAAALAACGLARFANASEESETESEGDPEADGSEEAPSFEMPELEGTLKIVATADYYGPLFDKFCEEAGISYEVLSMSSGEVLSKLRAEGGAPSADLWFGGGVDAFMSAADEGLLAPVTFAAADQIDPTYRDADGYWYTKGLTIVGFLASNELVEELGIDVPQTWTDLLDPSYEGEIVMSNPAVSGTNYAVVNALLQKMGEDEGWQYFTDLNGNIAYYAKRGADPSNKVSAGEYALGISYIDGTIEELAEEADLSIVYPSDGIPWIPDGVAAFANAENEAAASAFIAWLFSDDENLRLLAELDQKTSIKVIKPSLEGIELDFDTDALIEEDLSLFGSERDAILERFNELMGDKAVDE